MNAPCSVTAGKNQLILHFSCSDCRKCKVKGTGKSAFSGHIVNLTRVLIIQNYHICVNHKIPVVEVKRLAEFQLSRRAVYVKPVIVLTFSAVHHHSHIPVRIADASHLLLIWDLSSYSRGSLIFQRKKSDLTIPEGTGVVFIEEPHPRNQTVLHLLKSAYQTIWIALSILRKIVERNPVSNARILKVNIGNHHLGALRRQGHIHQVSALRHNRLDPPVQTASVLLEKGDIGSGAVLKKRSRHAMG